MRSSIICLTVSYTHLDVYKRQGPQQSDDFPGIQGKVEMIERGVVSEALRQVFTRYKFTHDFLPPQSFRQVAAGFPPGLCRAVSCGQQKQILLRRQVLF